MTIVSDKHLFPPIHLLMWWTIAGMLREKKDRENDP